MNIEHFEYYDLYSTPSSNMSNDTVIQFVIRFHRIYPWILFPLGFLGSLLTILIFTRKKFQKFGCSILFVAEGCMDLILITLNCVRLIIRYTFQSHFLQRSIFVCRTYKFLTNYLSHCAVWILCIISLERAAVTRRIVWNQTVFDRKHSYCTLVILFLLLFCLNLHYLIFFGSQQENDYPFSNNQTGKKMLAMCSSNLMRPSMETYDHFLTFYFSWMDFIINSLIPFIIILIANASVMYSVYQSRILIKKLALRQTRSPRDTQLAYILFVSTFLFLLLTFPPRVFSVMEPYLAYQKKYLIFADGLMRFLLYMDHGCGFYLYTFTGELFRRELKRFLFELLFCIFRRRVFNWSTIESRRQSELSCSNGGGAGLSHLIFSQPLGNLHLQDSISSTAGMRSSVHSLQTQKTLYNTYSYPCTHARQHHSTPLVRLKSSPGQESQILLNTNPTDLIEPHSSSCLESQYKTDPLIPSTDTLANDLDRKSDIVLVSD